MPGATCHRFCSKPSWTEFLGAALDWRWSSLAAAESGLNRAVCSWMWSSWDEFDTSKSKAAVPSGRKGLEYPLWFEDEILPQVEKFKGQKNSGFNSPSTFWPSGHELWVEKERMSFLCRMSGLCLGWEARRGSERSCCSSTTRRGRWNRSDEEASWWGFLNTPHQKETLGKIQDMLEGLCLPAGLGVFWDSPEELDEVTEGREAGPLSWGY